MNSWKLFGDGVHENFRELLISKLSPHLRATRLGTGWENGPCMSSPLVACTTRGGSRHAIKLAGYLSASLTGEVKRMCEAQTLAAEQKEVGRVHRKVPLELLLSHHFVQNEAWLWKAPGARESAQHHHDGLRRVPRRDGRPLAAVRLRCVGVRRQHARSRRRQHAARRRQPLLPPACAGPPPRHATPTTSPRPRTRSCRRLVFAGLRIHTDEICEVIDRMAPGPLSCMWSWTRRTGSTRSGTRRRSRSAR